MAVSLPLNDASISCRTLPNHEPQPRRCLQDRKTTVERCYSRSKGKTKRNKLFIRLEDGNADEKAEELISGPNF